MHIDLDGAPSTLSPPPPQTSACAHALPVVYVTTLKNVLPLFVLLSKFVFRSLCLFPSLFIRLTLFTCCSSSNYLRLPILVHPLRRRRRQCPHDHHRRHHHNLYAFCFIFLFS